jgi:Ni/Co efflux regulator RcnB
MHRIKILVLLVVVFFSTGTIAAQQHKPVKHRSHHTATKHRATHRKTAHKSGTAHRAPAQKNRPKAN